MTFLYILDLVRYDVQLAIQKRSVRHLLARLGFLGGSVVYREMRWRWDFWNGDRSWFRILRGA